MRPSFLHVALVLIGGLALGAPVARAQLTDESQTTPNVPKGAIAKSLEEQVGAGHGDAFPPGLSVAPTRRSRQKTGPDAAFASGPFLCPNDERDAEISSKVLMRP